MKQVYLDYSATTPVNQEVLKEMIPYLSDFYGNPSSLYKAGELSRNAIDLARSNVARLINSDKSEVYFTSSGTEADNWAVFGVADKFKNRGKHIITSSIEHHAILHAFDFLKDNGYEITLVKPDKEGIIQPEALKEAMRDDTILVSIMTVNNEIGTIQPIKELAKVAKEKGAIFHTDAVQALGNVHLDVKDLGVDLMSMSAHKIYGPKGTGALFIRKGLKISSIMHGGAQEKSKRAGTENLAGIVAFGKAAEIAYNNLDEHIAKMTELRNYLIDRLTSKIKDVTLNGSIEHRHPGNTNFTFKYIEGEALLLLLDMKGIAVSTGSACSSKSLEPSHVLMEIGVPVEEVHGSLRITVGEPTTKEEIDYCVDSLAEVVEKLRQLSPISAEKGWC